METKSKAKGGTGADDKSVLPTLCVLYSRDRIDFLIRSLAARQFKGELKVIGGRSSTWGNVRDLKKIEGEKFVFTNTYHMARLLALDPTLKVISAEMALGIPFRLPKIEIIKFHITKWLLYLRS